MIRHVIVLLKTEKLKSESKLSISDNRKIALPNRVWCVSALVANLICLIGNQFMNNGLTKAYS